MNEREALLRSFGASSETLAELLSYGENPYREGYEQAAAKLPLEDELHLEAWRDYAREAERDGAVNALGRRLVQFRFPIEEGMSEKSLYRAATRKGEWPDEAQEGLSLENEGAIELVLHAAPAGSVPVLVAGERADFETLVRALAGRNQPIPVPDAMGACLIKGLVNWDRVARYRAAWAGERSPSEAEWLQEFGRMATKKELYQDRLLLLSSGPYSAVAASELGLSGDEWLRDSLLIRRDHECFHYLTWRLFGLIRSNLLDEVLADFAGLFSAYDRYPAEMALRFLGLESYPSIREDARLLVYRGDPPVSDAALEALASLTHRAIAHLAEITESVTGELAKKPALSLYLLSLASMGLEELASEDFAERFEERWRSDGDLVQPHRG